MKGYYFCHSCCFEADGCHISAREAIKTPTICPWGNCDDPKWNNVLDVFTLDENTLIDRAKKDGVAIGLKPKARFNYLVKLGLLPKPITVHYGKSRGGKRVFHKETFRILAKIHEYRRCGLTFRDIRKRKYWGLTLFGDLGRKVEAKKKLDNVN